MRLIGSLLLLLILGCASNSTQENNFIKSQEELSVSVLNNGFNIVFDDGYEKQTIHIDSVVTNIDLYYLNSYHQLHLKLPFEFHNKLYKDTTISQSTGETNNTYTSRGRTYNSKSNVSSYYDHPCVVCSYIGYEYDVEYNSNNQVIKFGDESNHHTIKYDSTGDIIELLQFSGRELILAVNINKIY